MSDLLYSAKLKAVIAVLKRRYTNLTVEESIDLATDIIEAIDKAGQRT